MTEGLYGWSVSIYKVLEDVTTDGAAQPRLLVMIQLTVSPLWKSVSIKGFDKSVVATFTPFTFHWKDGVVPPLTGGFEKKDTLFMSGHIATITLGDFTLLGEPMRNEGVTVRVIVSFAAAVLLLKVVTVAAYMPVSAGTKVLRIVSVNF